jgi:hypothetical protein
MIHPNVKIFPFSPSFSLYDQQTLGQKLVIFIVSLYCGGIAVAVVVVI